jgi:hypothetical protein
VALLSKTGTIAAAMILMAISLQGAAQDSGTLVRTASTSRGIGQGGIRIDRLSPRQLRVWKRIESVVHAHDPKGRALHPILEMLWGKAESCVHDIFIELGARGPGNVGGKFTVEKLDLDGKRHSLSIRIYLRSIDEANTSQGARRVDGFIPFEGLYGERRYAEALGHEMVHAIMTLEDPGYATLVMEQRRLEFELAAHFRETGKVLFEGANQFRMRRLEFLAGVIEEPANAMEIEIWRELVKHACRKSGDSLR